MTLPKHEPLLFNKMRLGAKQTLFMEETHKRGMREEQEGKQKPALDLWAELGPREARPSTDYIHPIGKHKYPSHLCTSRCVKMFA